MEDNGEYDDSDYYTFHRIGDVEYRVDHDEERIYRKFVLPRKGSGDFEKKLYPLGYKWIETNGDYKRFMDLYNVPETPAPIIQNIEEPKPLIKVRKKKP